MEQSWKVAIAWVGTKQFFSVYEINVFCTWTQSNKCNKTKLHFHSGGRCDWHHCQTPHGNMEGYAERQKGKFQVHLCGCAHRGVSWYTRGNTTPQSETEVHCPGSFKAPQFGGMCSCLSNHLPYKRLFWMLFSSLASLGVFLISAAERLPNSGWLDEAEGATPDGAECDWSRARASPARRCPLSSATALWVIGNKEKVIQGQCHHAQLVTW